MKSRVSYDLMNQNTPNITGFTVLSETGFTLLSDNWQCCRKILASVLMQYTGLFLSSLFCFNFSQTSWRPPKEEMAVASDLDVYWCVGRNTD